MLAPATIPLSYALPVLQELEKAGHHRAELFRDAGLDAAWATDDAVALPALVFTRLYGFAIRLLEAETSQRTDHSRFSKDVVDMLCYCVINCADLTEAVERTVTFNRIIGPLGGTLTVLRQGASVKLIIDSRRRCRDTAALLVDLAGMNVYHQLFSWLIGTSIRLQSVAVIHPAPAAVIPMQDLFGVPLQYNQPVNQLTLSAHYLSQPVVRSYAELARIIDYFPFDIWFSGHATGRLSDRLRILLLSALQRQLRPPDADTAAQLFHMSVATLRRRLQEEGTSCARIRDDCQRECAEYLLTFTRLTVREIALQLGFGEDRTFRRAFRQWTGVGPAQFRRS